MSTWPLDSVKRSTNQSRRPYTPAERDAAFLVYLGAGKRSMTETSNLTGITRQSLYAWADEDHWEDRINGTDNSSTGTAALHGAEVARAMFPHLVQLASDRALRILADDKGNQNAQVKLALEVWGMHGWVAPKQSMSVVQHLTDQADQRVISMKDLAGLDPDQLAAWTGIEHDTTTDDDTTTDPDPQP